MAQLWSDYTDAMISDIDSAIGNKYGKLNLRKFLSDPTKFAAQPNISSDVQKMRDDTDTYFDTILGGLADRRKSLDDSLLKAEALTGQLSGNISMQAKQNRLPLVRPVSIDRDTSRDDIIYVESADSGVMALIEKLASSATYIADNTGTFNDRKIGEWIFGGDKSYVIRVYVPDNELVLVENSRNELNSLFDISMNYIKGAGGK